MSATPSVAGAAAGEGPRCLNCGAVAASAYCPECGQKTLLHPPSVREFYHEFVGQYIAREGKLWRTLALLAFRPGRLTTEYLQGRRNRYIIPLRLYLSASFLFFFIIKIAIPLVSPNEATLDSEYPLFIGDDDAKVERHGNQLTVRPTAPDEPPIVVELPDPADFGSEAMLHCADKGAHCARWKVVVAHAIQSMRTDPEQFRARFTERLLQNVSYALFSMLPVFALLLALLYRNRHMYFGEHMVFALHLHSFAFLAALVLALVPPLSSLGMPLLFGYGVWALHQVYGGGWVATVLRSALLYIVYSMILGLATAALVVYLVLT